MEQEGGTFEPKSGDKTYAPIEKTSKCHTRDHKRTTVRFTDEEYDRITDEAKVSGESLPALLKRSHFRRQKLKLLFSEFERHSVCSELRRIGNNVNQIARRVNSGALEGWYKEFTEVSQRLSELCSMVAGAYGGR
jgi:hypothetical protein